jgi:hypothetical protein
MFWSLKNVVKKDQIFRIERDLDYINSPKYDNSLTKLLSCHPNGVSDHVICKVLCITQRELDNIYESAIMKLREGMGVDEI